MILWAGTGVELILGVCVAVSDFTRTSETSFGLSPGLGRLFVQPPFLANDIIKRMVIIFTGNGKGKTTAALGQAFRTLGRGKRVLMIQFIKGPWKSGEDELVHKFKTQKSKFSAEGGSPPEADGPQAHASGGKTSVFLEDLENFYDFEIRKLGLGFVGILGDQLPKERHAEAARAALDVFKRDMGQGTWDMIILDEINVATSLGLLTKEEVLEALKPVPDEKFVILTGRGAPQEFIDRADLVTEMKEIKHPFNDGKMAKIAMEF